MTENEAIDEVLRRSEQMEDVGVDTSANVLFTREWGMPTRDTFNSPPIRKFVERHVGAKRLLRPGCIVVDPFARNCKIGDYRNDLNEKTTAEYHMDAFDFLAYLNTQEVKADLVIFDPPFSPTQIKECYDDIGKKMRSQDVWRTHWTPERNEIHKMLKPDGVVLSFGWNSIGMGKKRGYKIREVLLVCHGPGHNDTICICEVLA